VFNFLVHLYQLFVQVLLVVHIRVEASQFTLSLLVLHLNQQISLGLQPQLSLLHGLLLLLWLRLVVLQELLVLFPLFPHQVLQALPLVFFRLLLIRVLKSLLLPKPFHRLNMLPLLVQYVAIKVKSSSSAFHLNWRQIEAFALLLLRLFLLNYWRDFFLLDDWLFLRLLLLYFGTLLLLFLLLRQRLVSFYDFFFFKDWLLLDDFFNNYDLFGFLHLLLLQHF